MARDHATADEQVDVAVPIEVGGDHRSATAAQVGQSIFGAAELAAPVIHIQAIGQALVAGLELDTAADNIQIQIAVSVRLA